MSTLPLHEDIGLDLIVVNSESGYVTVAVSLRGMTVAAASAMREHVYVLASGTPCLAVGCAHFPLAFAHLKWAAEVLDMPVRGAAA